MRSGKVASYLLPSQHIFQPSFISKKPTSTDCRLSTMTNYLTVHTKPHVNVGQHSREKCFTRHKERSDTSLPGTNVLVLYMGGIGLIRT